MRRPLHEGQTPRPLHAFCSRPATGHEKITPAGAAPRPEQTRNSGCRSGDTEFLWEAEKLTRSVLLHYVQVSKNGRNTKQFTELIDQEIMGKLSRSEVSKGS